MILEANMEPLLFALSLLAFFNFSGARILAGTLVQEASVTFDGSLYHISKGKSDDYVSYAQFSDERYQNGQALNLKKINFVFYLL